MNKFLCFSLLLISLIFIPNRAVWGDGLADPRPILEIPETVVLKGSKITLKELGTLKGGTTEIVALLQRVDLGATPRPGERRTFSKGYLSFIMQQYGLADRLSLEMPEEVTVKVNSTCILGAEIEETIQALCREKKADLIKKWVELSNLPKEVWLSQGNWKIEAFPVGPLPEVGRALFKVVFSNGKENKSINISGKIKATALVYRAKRDIAFQSEVNPADFEKLEAELTNSKVLVGEIPAGHRSTKKIKLGEILQVDQIQPIPLVLKDHQVVVCVRDGNVEIKILGKAMNDGWLGDQILISNPTSKKIFRGRVSGNGTVEVIIE